MSTTNNSVDRSKVEEEICERNSQALRRPSTEIYDWICLEEVLANEHYQFKAIFNASGIIFFPVSRQHRETRAEGISYDDGPTGNALAAVISPGKVDIRNHPRFVAERVRRILEKILQDGRLEPLRGFTVTYQGKVIKPGARENERDGDNG